MKVPGRPSDLCKGPEKTLPGPFPHSLGIEVRIVGGGSENV